MKNLYWKLQSVNGDFENLKELYQQHNKKDYKTGELFEGQELENHFNQNASKNPLTAKLYSLCLGYVESGSSEIRIKYLTGDEADLIQTFLNTMNSEYFKNHKVTHFGADITLPYFGIRKSVVGNTLPLPKDLKYFDSKPWNLSGLCLKDYFKGAGNYTYNLKELAYIKGLCTANESVDLFVDHNEENDYFRAGAFQKLEASAVEEIKTLINVHRVELGMSIITQAVVDRQEVKAVEQETVDTILVEFYKTKVFNAKKFEKHLKDKKLLKKDHSVVKKLILAAYLEKIDIMDYNKAPLIEINSQRTEEIENFFTNFKK